jgi:hypothetical protein
VHISGFTIRKDAPRNKQREKKEQRKTAGTKDRKQHQQSDAAIRQKALEDSGLTRELAKVEAEALKLKIKDRSKALASKNRMMSKEEVKQRKVELVLRSLRDRLAELKVKLAELDFKGQKTGPRIEDIVSERDELAGFLKIDLKHVWQLRDVVRDLRREILPMRAEMKALKQRQYDYSRYAKSSPASDTSCKAESKPNAESNHEATTTGSAFSSTPTLLRPGCLDEASSVNIKKLVQEIKVSNADGSKRKTTLMPGGTDPGGHILFSTVPVPEPTLIKLQNRFALLDNGSSELPDILQEDKDLIKYHDGKRKDILETIKLPKAHLTTVEQIRHHSGLNRQARKREKAAKKSGINNVFDYLATDSIQKATTQHEVEEAQQKRRDCQMAVRDFEQSRKMVNMRHHKELRLKQTYDRLAAQERKAFQAEAWRKSGLTMDGFSLQQLQRLFSFKHTHIYDRSRHCPANLFSLGSDIVAFDS